VIIGGKGPRRTPALAARFADEFNVAFAPLDVVTAQFERVAQACADAGRDPSQLIRSCAHTLVFGATSADVARRGDSLGLSADELSTDPLAGTPAQIVDQLGQWREQTGITRVYLQVLDLADLDQLDLVAAQVAPQLA